ncbi:hypothetical protein KJI95_05550 [Shewanella sp. JM162201]|uniref:Uncharacterized protein n=1 Tax=Shewanella jiangmenensis TaxID=2837387 RepID=A0ABS5V242_9GAMM|nr:hypothetical protein [Shewanella jiangmenensis]MBT1443990.1 hypothetical protein [Shewanella jiangmenensis]
MTKSGTMEKEVAASAGEQARSWRQDPLIQSFMRLLGLFRRSPALMLSLTYLSAGLMGLLYNAWLLWQFDFNVLPYLELSDVLLATLHYPQIIMWLVLFCCGFVLVSMLALWINERRGKSARPQKLPVWAWVIPVLLTYLVMAALMSAKTTTEKVHAGLGQWYRVQLSYPLYQSEQQKTLYLPRAQFITRTASYLFMMHEGQLTVLPHSNISALEPLAQAVAQEQ